MNIVGDDEGPLFARVYGFRPEGNWVEEASGHNPGTNIPHLEGSLTEIAERENIDPIELARRLEVARERLLEARGRRPFPHVDDKILASWNGLMIGALARAAAIFENERYLAAAQAAAQFVITEMFSDGLLLRSWRDGRAHVPGYLDDYAYLAQGLVELYHATSRQSWLEEADRLATQMLERFEDRSDGGFFYASAEHDALLRRSKSTLGGGNIPSASAVGAQVLLALGEITGKTQYTESARRTLSSLAGWITHGPLAVDDLLLATSVFLDHEPTGQIPQSRTDGRSGVAAQYGPADVSAHKPRAEIASMWLSPSISIQAGICTGRARPNRSSRRCH
jgi:uncharacterized protein YyaL (SSP411 family)